MSARGLLTHSSIAAFKACERRYGYRYHLGLEPAKTSPALRLGDAFHAGLDEIFTRRQLEPALTRVAELYQDVPSSLPDPSEWAVECETCLALLTAWYYRYAAGELPELVASELPFEIVLRNPKSGRASRRWKMAGKIDRLINPAAVELMEHKTTSETITPDSDYLMRLRIDPQISHYILAARALGYPVQGITYDITRKPSIRPKAPTKADLAELYRSGVYCGVELSADELQYVNSAKETPAMFGARLVADIASRPDFYFTRLQVARLEDDLERFQAETWNTQQRISETVRSGIFLSNPGACLLPYRCAFADLCFAGYTAETIPEGFIPEGYRHGKTLHPELET